MASSAPLIASPSADSEASLSSVNTLGSSATETSTSASSYSSGGLLDVRHTKTMKEASSDEETGISSGSSRATRRVKFPSSIKPEEVDTESMLSSGTKEYDGSVRRLEEEEDLEGNESGVHTSTYVPFQASNEPSPTAIYQPTSPHKAFRRSYTTASISSVPFNTRAATSSSAKSSGGTAATSTGSSRPAARISGRSHSSANVSSMASSPPSPFPSSSGPIEDASRNRTRSTAQPRQHHQSISHGHSHSMSLSLSSPGSSSSVTSPTVATRHAPPRRQTTASFSHNGSSGGAPSSSSSAALSALYNSQSELDRQHQSSQQQSQLGDTRRHSVDYLAAIAAATSNNNNNGRTLRSPVDSTPAASASTSSYSSLAADPRWRKTSLGSQTLLSSNGDLMSAQTSGSRAQVSPTRTREEASTSGQYLSHPNPHPLISHATSPRFDSNTHDSQHHRTNQLEAKIVLLGRQGVGKTSLVHRYMTGQFSSSLPTTIGASFLVKKVVMDGVKVRLQIWDTAGQERFRSMAPMYYRGAHAAILVYDITNEESLADIQVWLDELRRNMSSDLMIQIVGHKADLAPTHRRVTLEHAKTEISKWIAASSNDSTAASANLAAPSSRRFPSGSSSTAQGAEDSTSSGRPSLTSFGLSRSASRNKDTKVEPVPPEPVWRDIAISEVSAKQDEGIEDLFLTIAAKLVERKVQIENDRVLRSKDSIMITDEQKIGNKADDPTRVWGCC